MNAVSIRGDWVGTTIDGRFSLIAWLGGSGTSGVFLAELPGSTAISENTDSKGSPKAAIKLIPASPAAEDRLAIWTSAASLSHPHLLRILAFGRTEVDGAGLLYVRRDWIERNNIGDQIILNENILGPAGWRPIPIHDRGVVNDQPPRAFPAGRRLRAGRSGQGQTGAKGNKH